MKVFPLSWWIPHGSTTEKLCTAVPKSCAPLHKMIHCGYLEEIMHNQGQKKTPLCSTHVNTTDWSVAKNSRVKSKKVDRLEFFNISGQDDFWSDLKQCILIKGDNMTFLQSLMKQLSLSLDWNHSKMLWGGGKTTLKRSCNWRNLLSLFKFQPVSVTDLDNSCLMKAIGSFPLKRAKGLLSLLYLLKNLMDRFK